MIYVYRIKSACNGLPVDGVGVEPLDDGPHRQNQHQAEGPQQMPDKGRSADPRDQKAADDEQGRHAEQGGQGGVFAVQEVSLSGGAKDGDLVRRGGEGRGEGGRRLDTHSQMHLHLIDLRSVYNICVCISSNQCRVSKLQTFKPE